MGRCTRCFGKLDREPSTFAEQFSDSAWCTHCWHAWLAGGYTERKRLPPAPRYLTDRQTIPERPRV